MCATDLHESIRAALFLAWQDFAYDDSKVEFNVDAPNGVVMEGYLFKRASNAFKTWNRYEQARLSMCLSFC